MMRMLSVLCALWFGVVVCFAAPKEVRFVGSVRETYSDQVSADALQKVTLEFLVLVDTNDPLDELKKHLESEASYKFSNEWPGVSGLVALSSESTVFQLFEAKVNVPAGQPGRWIVALEGVSRANSRGEIHVAGLGGWKFDVVLAPDQPYVAVEPVHLKFSLAPPRRLRNFRMKVGFGYGQSGPSVDFAGSGVLSLRPARAMGPLTSLSLEGKLALRKPDDVLTGGDSTASEEIPDALSLSLDHFRYQKGGNLTAFGVRGRANGALDGGEIVGYYSPFTLWADQMHFFGSAEAEVGFRSNNIEWKNVTTRADDPGRFVGRVGFVVEWFPHLGPVNKVLGEGLNFYVRGRGWLDSADSSGSRIWRFRPFVDAELFLNIQGDYRLFIRYERGYLPPDLSNHVGRVFVGIGAGL